MSVEERLKKLEDMLVQAQLAALNKRVEALEAEVARLERAKCTHMSDDWGDGCRNCNDGIQKETWEKTRMAP